MLFGVAAGMADYFGIDPTLMRLLWVLAGLSGFGVPGYIIAAIIIPLEPEFVVKDPSDPSAAEETAGQVITRSTTGEAGSGNRILGWGLIILGTLFLINHILPRWAWNRLWPVVLIGLGIYLLIDRGRSA